MHVTCVLTRSCTLLPYYRVYWLLPSTQIRAKLRRSSEEYVMTPRLDGGSIAITLTRKDHLIVALRVQVRCYISYDNHSIAASIRFYGAAPYHYTAAAAAPLSYSAECFRKRMICICNSVVHNSTNTYALLYIHGDTSWNRSEVLV
jgi:hypothetical protein